MMMADFSLTDKVAVVTGATKGLGLGIARGLAEAGANLVIVSRSQKDCEATAEEMKVTGRQVFPCAADLRELDSIRALVRAAVERFGRIDILVNNAGAAITKPPEAMTEEDWDFVMDLNLKGAFFTAQQVGMQMIKQQYGKIINVASVFGFVGDGNVVSYCASKGGLVLITKSLALAWARHNIRVNAIAPGYIATEINKETLRQEKVFNHLMKNTPVRRLGEVKDVVGAAVFLASSASDYMTGESIVMDGGWLAH
jgi:NAD(P)-dependent dehydrogenase (short-subunit alcohol dehydrogenase family)